MDPDGPWSPHEPAPDKTARPPRSLPHPDPTLGWWRRMWPLLRARRVAFFASLAGAAVSMVGGVLLPRITMGAIDRALVDRTQALGPYLWAIVTIAVVRGVLAYSYRKALYTIAYDLEYDLRAGLFGHLSRLDFAFFDRVQTGQLISRANSDIRSVQMFLTFAPLLALNIFSFAVAVALMLSIHVGLTLVVLATLPFTYLASNRLRNIVFPMSWIVQARTADLATIVDENIQGVRVVKGFAAEQQELTKLARSAQRLRWAAVLTNDARARWGPLIENLPRFGLVAVLLYGGKLAIDGDIGIGAIVAFNAYIVLLQAPFRFLSTILMLGQRAAASADRIFELLDEHPTITDRPGAVDLPPGPGVVELRGATFAYASGEPLIEGIDLRIEPGETIAFVGRTGSGKSTIGRLLPRFYDVTAGAVLIDGHDVRDVTLASLRAAVGIVLDEPFLFSDTLRANIAFGRPDATEEEVHASVADAQAGFLNELPAGLDTVIGERGYDLSGGQRQRISLARALLADPRVLVLDDATSAVDVEVEQRIHDALRHRRAGRTTILIAQRLSTIALADRVVLLEDGRIAAQGTHTELLATEPRYAAVLARADATPDGALPVGGD
ncbi:MAG TPA: ABC transporter ATP-binding protein [Acidimicrobiales bacterium]